MCWWTFLKYDQLQQWCRLILSYLFLDIVTLLDSIVVYSDVDSWPYEGVGKLDAVTLNLKICCSGIFLWKIFLFFRYPNVAYCLLQFIFSSIIFSSAMVKWFIFPNCCYWSTIRWIVFLLIWSGQSLHPPFHSLFSSPWPWCTNTINILAVCQTRFWCNDMPLLLLLLLDIGLMYL